MVSFRVYCFCGSESETTYEIPLGKVLFSLQSIRMYYSVCMRFRVFVLVLVISSDTLIRAVV